MNGLDYFTAGWLGVLQGFTEFLPISSSGHLAIVQRRLELDPDSPPLLMFDVAVHLGTLLAIIVVYRHAALRFVQDLLFESNATGTTPHLPRRVLMLGVLATIPTAVIGLTFKARFEAAFDRPAVIGICFVFTGVLLALLTVFPRGRRGWKKLKWWEAVLVGLAQALAIFPGISRSGATICMASYCGWRRQWAAQFSFLIAVPAIAGGTILKIRDVAGLTYDPSLQIPWGPIVLGSVVALLVGIVALQLLLRTIQRGRLQYFAAYCFVAGAVVLTGCT